MAKKSHESSYPENLAPITRQPITETLEKNYMPYVMTVIVSRAIPDIDGFKPSHRKLLYMMNNMNLLTGPRTKSANVVGATMRLNPHGDASIYETMVRLTRGYAALLHPFVDSKGSFGKQYSRDMAYAAPRYTEVKLDPICEELMSGIEKNAVDMVPNYDNTMMEPVLLPTTFPNILVSPNLGIAVGMTSNICSFNLNEICDGTIAMLKNPQITCDEMMDIVRAPDFSGGGYIIYERDVMKQVFETGLGSIKQRAKYVFDKKTNTINILEIPYVSTIESITKKILDMMKEGRLKNVVDVRDAIDLNGFRISVELKKDADPEKTMATLFKSTDLERAFDCNFNVLINSVPQTLGVLDILREWIKFRVSCLRRELEFDLKKKEDKLHILQGLAVILLDIDKAIRIIRQTEKESDVVKNLMNGFGISQVQAEYVAEIKLRHLNREYIINRVQEIEDLQKEIERIKKILSDDKHVKHEIALQLEEIKKKYGKPRQSLILDSEEIPEVEEEAPFDNYPCRVYVTKEGYFKKITMQSLKGNDEQKLKEEDRIVYFEDTENKAFLTVFTNLGRMYRTNIHQFDNTKASMLGDYLPAKLEMDQGEYVIGAKALLEWNPNHHYGFIFENGKAVRTPLSEYETKGNRKRLVNVFSTSSPCVGVFYEGDKPVDVFILSVKKKGILINSNLIPEKPNKAVNGTRIYDFVRGEKKLVLATSQYEDEFPTAKENCRKRKVPTEGNTL